MGGYTTREVSDLIGLQPHQVRHYVRRDLLQPERGERGEYRFTFQDVVLLRSAKGLLDANVSVRKAYRTLTKLQQELAQIKSLAAVRIFAAGNNVDAQAAAMKISATAAEIPARFKDGKPGANRAKPEIWTNFADFTAKANDLKAAADGVAADAAAGKLGSDPKAVVGKIGATCGACHKAYRGPKV